MFNLLVSGNGMAWEEPDASMDVGRFKEYSGANADAINLVQPETLSALEAVPTLLMYETGASGPNPRLVRHGRLRNIRRVGREIQFTFEPEPQRAYLSFGDILEFADQLGLHRFEQHRTHWAVKDGQLPEALLARATAEPPKRTLATIAREYREALEEGSPRRQKDLKDELEAIPPSLDKAVEYLRIEMEDACTPKSYPHLGVRPKTREGREAVERVVSLEELKEQNDTPISLAWFLDVYGSPTEHQLLELSITACAARVAKLVGDVRNDAADLSLDNVVVMLWRIARSSLLQQRLRRDLHALVEHVAHVQHPAGYWIMAGVPELRTTAMATVALQRLGDDKHRDAIRRAVLFLCSQCTTEGALPRSNTLDDADILATVLMLEAVRRSGLASELGHVLEAGEAWMLKAQGPLGEWSADDWPDVDVTTAVLDYFADASAMQPQVDGFFLMSRDFYRKAQELALEGGTNNRRLAAIAAVHAMEMFLYGLFERRPDLGLSAYRDDGTTTLGPREALSALQSALWGAGLLAKPRRLLNRDQLSGLVGKRDGIIHRAHEITENELAEGLRAVRSFIVTYGADLATLDILQ